MLESSVTMLWLLTVFVVVFRTWEWQRWVTWRGSCRASESSTGTAAPVRPNYCQVILKSLSAGPSRCWSWSVVQIRICYILIYCCCFSQLPRLVPLLPSVTSSIWPWTKTKSMASVTGPGRGLHRSDQTSLWEKIQSDVHQCLVTFPSDQSAFKTWRQVQVWSWAEHVQPLCALLKKCTLSQTLSWFTF